MDLEEFRDRTAKGLKPRELTMDEEIHAQKDEFEARCKRFKHLGIMHMWVHLRLAEPHDKLFFDWMVSTKYDAYTLYIDSDTGRKMVTRCVSGKRANEIRPVIFVPKGATKEEIELSTNATYVS